jgi:hypothetical protein
MSGSRRAMAGSGRTRAFLRDAAITRNPYDRGAFPKTSSLPRRINPQARADLAEGKVVQMVEKIYLT